MSSMPYLLIVEHSAANTLFFSHKFFSVEHPSEIEMNNESLLDTRECTYYKDSIPLLIDGANNVIWWKVKGVICNKLDINYRHTGCEFLRRDGVTTSNTDATGRSRLCNSAYSPANLRP